MSITTKFILKCLHVLTWVIFLGLCVKAGSVLFSYLVSVYRNDVAAKDLHIGLDLSQLKTYDPVEYGIMAISIVLITAIQALLFYQLVRIFLKINFVNPFSETIEKLIRLMSGLSLIIGLFSKVMTGYAKKFIAMGMDFPKLNEHIGLGDAYLIFAGILFVIATVFKRGIELQSENELTV